MFNLFDNSNTDNFEFLIDQIGSDVIINEASTPIRAIITNTKSEAYHDDRKISALSPLNRSDIVLFNGQKYMLISEVNERRYNKFKGIMRRLTHTIIVNSSCRFCALDCYVTSTELSVSGGQVISTAKGEIQVYASQINMESEVKISDRFLLDGQAFKITGIDSFSMPGTVVLTCEKDQINPAIDDLVNSIAGGLACPTEPVNPEPLTKTIMITSNRSTQQENGYLYVYYNTNATFTATVYNEGVAIDNVVKLELFSDDQASAVDASKFQAMSFDGNTVTITVKNTNYYFWVKATLLSDSSINTWQRIRVKGYY